MLWGALAQAQNLKAKVSIDVENQPLRAVLESLEEQTDIQFFYPSGVLDALPSATLKVENRSVEEVFHRLFVNTEIGYKAVGGQLVLKLRSKTPATEGDWVFPSDNQRRYTVSGVLRDRETGEEVAGALLLLDQERLGTTTNAYGFYSLTLPEGDHNLLFTMLGFEELAVPLQLDGNKRLDLAIGASPSTLAAIQITADSGSVFRNGEWQVQLPMRHYQALPPLLGAQDILEGVRAQPGVTRKAEGSSGFHVRGGNLDQNLILIDEAPVYNESHFMGFLSVFNRNTLKSSTFYRSGIPARYGGRLSSVLDLRMKEGNMNHWASSGELNPLFMQATVEGPIISDKVSVLISGRRSYADLIADYELEDAFNLRDFSFYDLNGKLNVKLGKNDHIYLSGYSGSDLIQSDGEESFLEQWGNNTGTLRWNHVFGNKLFSNVSLIASAYDYQSSEEFDDDEYFFALNITDLTAKTDWNYYPNPKHTMRFGASIASHYFLPGLEETSETGFELLELVPPQTAVESGVYVSDEYTFHPDWKLYAGLRYSIFENVGEATVFQFADDGSVIGRQDYTDEDGTYNEYAGFEPRVQLQWTWKPTARLSLQFDRTRQYLHLASNSILKAPTDLWIPSSPNIAPQLASQVSIDQTFELLEGMFGFTVGAYVKEIDNSIDFLDRANLVVNELIESEIRQGKVRAMGMEVQLEKYKGALTGAVHYTFSRARATINDINNNEEYIAAYDRPHDLRAWANYQINDRWKVSGGFELSSGLPFNLPIGNYELNDVIVPVYGPKNSDRLPTYHRLDLGLSYRSKAGHWIRHEFGLFVYNMYNRRNAYRLRFDGTSEGGLSSGNISYVFPVLPSLTYRFQIR